MNRRVCIFPRAEQDAQVIFDYLANRSSDGAIAWWSALEAAIDSLASDQIEAYQLAPEDDLSNRTLRQFLFKTRRGQVYRGIFVFDENEVIVLRIRGPGQSTIASTELP